MTSRPAKAASAQPRTGLTLWPGMHEAYEGAGIPQPAPDNRLSLREGSFAESANALLIVCDSLHSVGAANDAIEVFSAHTTSFVKLAEGTTAPADMHPLQELQRITLVANQRAYEKSRHRTRGTLRIALTACLIINERAYITTVGDNRVFQIRNQQVRTIVEPDAHVFISYLGDQQELPQFATTGRPDFIHSFIVDLTIDDRLVICSAALIQQLTPNEPGTTQQRAAIVGERVLAYDDPRLAVLELTKTHRSTAVRALWQPLEEKSGTAQQPVTLSGGAVVLSCADAALRRQAKHEQQHRAKARYVFTFLTLLVVMSGIFAGSTRLLAAYNDGLAMQTAIAAATATQAALHRSTAITTPTATALMVILHTPQPTLPNITVTPRPSRTPTTTNIPTLTFTPSPTPTPTPTPPPPSPPNAPPAGANVITPTTS